MNAGKKKTTLKFLTATKTSLQRGFPRFDLKVMLLTHRKLFSLRYSTMRLPGLLRDKFYLKYFENSFKREKTFSKSPKAFLVSPINPLYIFCSGQNIDNN